MLGTFNLVTTLWFSAAWGSYATRLIDGFGLSEQWYGVFLLTQGAGGIIGSLLAVRIAHRIGTGKTIVLAASMVGLGVIAIGLPSLVLAGMGFFVTSFGVLVSNVHTMSIRQSLVPSELLGRVHGTFRTFLWGSMPFGAVLGGILGRVDLALPFLIGGGLYLLATLLFARHLTELTDLVRRGGPGSDARLVA